MDVNLSIPTVTPGSTLGDTPSEYVKRPSGTTSVQRGNNTAVESESSEQSVYHRKVSINTQSPSESEDITINDPEFNPPSKIKKLALAIKIFRKSFKEMSQINNPETDRSARVESIRKKTFTVSQTIFKGLASVVSTVVSTAISLGILGGIFYLTTIDPTAVILFPLALPAMACTVIGMAIAGWKLASAIASFITSAVSALVDTREKLAEMTSSNTPGAKFLNKYQRMEESLRALQIRRHAAMTAKIDKMADSPLKDARRAELESQRAKLKISHLNNEKWIDAYQRSCLRDYEGNIENLDDAISKTEDWLKRAEKQKNLLNKAQQELNVGGTSIEPDTERMEVRDKNPAHWVSV